MTDNSELPYNDTVQRNAVTFMCPECDTRIKLSMSDPYYMDCPKWCAECQTPLQEED